MTQERANRISQVAIGLVVVFIVTVAAVLAANDHSAPTASPTPTGGTMEITVSVAGMAFVLVGFVRHLEALRGESLRQL